MILLATCPIHPPPVSFATSRPVGHTTVYDALSPSYFPEGYLISLATVLALGEKRPSVSRYLAHLGFLPTRWLGTWHRPKSPVYQVQLAYDRHHIAPSGRRFSDDVWQVPQGTEMTRQPTIPNATAGAKPAHGGTRL